MLISRPTSQPTRFNEAAAAAAENVTDRGPGFGRGPRFNEAAAAAAENVRPWCKDKLARASASMRPRPRPRKTRADMEDFCPAADASMRPRPRPRKTAGRLDAHADRTVGFNEAAAAAAENVMRY